MSISYSSIFQSYQYVYSISMWVHTDTHTYIHNINTGVWPHLENYCSTESLQLVQFSSVAQSCSTLCDPMNCNMPGIPLHHQLLEPTQTHVHWVSDAIQPSHSLLSPSPPAFFPSIRVFSNNSVLRISGQSIGVSASASVLPMNIQDWFPLGWTGWISLQSKGLSRVFSNITVQKHQFFSAQLSL